MTATSRRKGADGERAVVRYLTDHGFPNAERRLSGGDNDRGDITGTPALVWEVKNTREARLGPWVDQLADEIVAADADYGAVVHKRAGKRDPGEWFATLPLADLCRLLVDAGYGDPESLAHDAERPPLVVNPTCAERFGIYGQYDPECCRWPKACSPLVYAADEASEPPSG